jgi:hypothetical protein
MFQSTQAGLLLQVALPASESRCTAKRSSAAAVKELNVFIRTFIGPCSRWLRVSLQERDDLMADAVRRGDERILGVPIVEFMQARGISLDVFLECPRRIIKSKQSSIHIVRLLIGHRVFGGSV